MDYKRKPKFQLAREVTIDATLEKVWEFNQDLSKIPEYHPRVSKVDLLSNTRFRKVGAAYQCHLTDGKNTCIEKDIEIIPMKKIVTILPFDTMGIAKQFPDYIVETTFKKTKENSARMKIAHFYSVSGVKFIVLNFFIKRKIAHNTRHLLLSIKKSIENENHL